MSNPSLIDVAQRSKMMADKPKKWIQKAVKREDALTAKAHAAGQSPMAFARSHAHSPGLTGQQARFALIAQGKKIPGGASERRSKMYDHPRSRKARGE